MIRSTMQHQPQAHTHDLLNASSHDVDPVCGMTIHPDKAAGHSEFGGQTIYFCSLGCKTKFDARPAQYAK